MWFGTASTCTGMPGWSVSAYWHNRRDSKFALIRSSTTGVLWATMSSRARKNSKLHHVYIFSQWFQLISTTRFWCHWNSWTNPTFVWVQDVWCYWFQQQNESFSFQLIVSIRPFSPKEYRTMQAKRIMKRSVAALKKGRANSKNVDLLASTSSNHTSRTIMTAASHEPVPRSILTIKTQEDSVSTTIKSKKANEASVTFGNVEVRSHEIILGGQPSSFRRTTCNNRLGTLWLCRLHCRKIRRGKKILHPQLFRNENAGTDSIWHTFKNHINDDDYQAFEGNCPGQEATIRNSIAAL